MSLHLLLATGSLGTKSLYLLLAWLASCIICQELSVRKGYGDRWGLASGMLLTVLGILIWLVVPAREGSSWKVDGPTGRRSRAS